MCQHPVVIEPTPIGDTFVTGVARIEILGHNARFYLHVDQNSFDPGRPPDRFIVAKIVVPLDSLPEMIRQTLAVTVAEATSKLVETAKGFAHMN